jgi:hypothetical protein
MLFDWADEWLNVYWTVSCRVATACHRSLFHFDQVFFLFSWVCDELHDIFLAKSCTKFCKNTDILCSYRFFPCFISFIVVIFRLKSNVAPGYLLEHDNLTF